MSLIVFIKNIQPGKVKTRLAAAVGNERAVQIYQALLDRTRQAALATETARYVFYSDFVPENDAWDERFFVKKTQHGADLGERMHHALATVLEKNDRAILVGGDIAGLTSSILVDALQKLETHDAVIGPALDGGYYLIGLKSPQPAVFQGIKWSHEHTCQQTLEKIKALGLSCYLLPPLSDIDYLEDWEKFGWKV